jgi:hypothetical protein
VTKGIRSIDWVVGIFFTILLAFFVILTIEVFTYKPKPVPITHHCEGDYEVFIRGDQFDVLFSEECERRNVKPPVLTT